MSNYVTNSQLRDEAKTAVRQNLGRIILMNLARFAAVYGVISVALCFSTGSIGTFISGVERLSSTRYVDFTDVMNVVLPLLGMLSLPVVISSVLSSAMNLGYLNGLIQMTRGSTVKASVVLSRLRHVLASLGLPMWVGLKTSVWGLPGYLVTMLGGLITASAATTRDFQYSTSFTIAHLFVIVGVVVAVAGALLMMILMIAAHYRYAMATYILADDPIVGVYDAVEKSKAMMLGRKFQLFRLGFFYGLLAVVVIIGASLLILVGGLLSEVIGVFSALFILAAMALMTVALVLLSLQAQMANACFYESHRAMRG